MTSRGTTVYAGIAVAALFTIWFLALRPDRAPPSVAAEIERGTPVVLAAPGRIEGISELVEVAAGVDGIVSAVLVREGQQLRKGQAIATIACDDLAADFRGAASQIESARQTLNRIMRGSRDEERRQAAAESSRVQALLARDRKHYARMKELAANGDIAAEKLDHADAELKAAEAQARAASEREMLINAVPLPEEVARAEAELKTAEQRFNQSRAKLEKCSVRAPMPGTVLRCHKKAGEAVSTVFPEPIVSLMDTSQIQVRAEVDERDIGRVRLGQAVRITAESFEDRPFEGRVVSIGSLMGRKRVRTGDPAEKNDRDILEVLAGVSSPDERLIVGLRVTVQFLGHR